jgi:hypothetical protein
VTPPANPCWLDTGFQLDVPGQVPPFELPPFSAPHTPSIDDIFDADPIGPGIELPNIFTANSWEFDEVYYDGTPIGRRDTQLRCNF